MSDKTEATTAKAAAPKKAAASTDSAKSAKAAKPAATTTAAAATKKAASSSSSSSKKDASKKPAAAKKKASGKKVARPHNTPAKKRYMVAPVRLRVKVAQEEKLNLLRHLQRKAPKGADKKIFKKKRVLSPKAAVLKRLAAQNLANKNKIAEKQKNKAALAAGKLVVKKQKSQQKRTKRTAPKSKKSKKTAKKTEKPKTTTPTTPVDPKEKLAQIFKKKKEQRQKRKEQQKKLKARLQAGEQFFLTTSSPESAKKKIEKKLKSSPTSLSEYALKKRAALRKIRNERRKVYQRTGKYPAKPTKEQLKAAIAAAKPAKVPQHVTKAAAAKKAEKEEAKKNYALALAKKKKKEARAKAKATKKAATPKVKKEKKKKPAAEGDAAAASDATSASATPAAAATKKTTTAGPKNVRKPHHKYEAIAIGLNRGYQVTKRVPPPRHSRRKGVTSRRVRAIKDIIREVSGFTPYEKRIMELLRNNLDKRALKFAKKRLGSHTRAKKKREEMQNIIQKMRAN